MVPVPARITAKEAGRSWTWSVGVVDLAHRVEPRGEGCVVAIDIEAPAALEPLVRATYGPVVGVLVRRLAAVAERPDRRGLVMLSRPWSSVPAS